MRRTTILLAACLLLVAAPALAQTATPAPGAAPEVAINVPEGSPWWAALAIGFGSLIFWGIRRWINSRFEQQKAALDEREQLFKSDLEEKQRKFQLEMACVSQSDALAESIQSLATSVSEAYKNLAEDRKQAADERRGFTSVMEGNTARIDENTKELAKLRKAVGDISEQSTAVLAQVEQLKRRIGESPDNRSLVEVVEAAAVDMRAATEAMQRAEQRATAAMKGDTGPLDASRVPQEPPAAKEPDPWQTNDNPPNLPPETK